MFYGHGIRNRIREFSFTRRSKSSPFETMLALANHIGYFR